MELYVPDIKYIKGPDNDSVDALSRITLINSDVKESDITREHLAEICCIENFNSNTLPLTYCTIDKYQQNNKELSEKLKRANYHTKYFRGGGNTLILICKNDKIGVPNILRKYVVNWYYLCLLHPVT